MADSLCGPSHAGKSLLSHSERDRSLHQDRTRGLSSRSPFGIQNASTSAGEAGFQSFMSSGGLFGPEEAALQSYTHPLASPQFHSPSPSPAFALGRTQPPLPGGLQQANDLSGAWATQFSQQQSPVAANMPSTAPMMAPGMSMGASTNAFQGSQFASASPFMGQMFSTPMNNYMYRPMEPNPVAMTEQTGIQQGGDLAQFDQAFNDFAGASFEDDVTETAIGESQASNTRVETDSGVAEQQHTESVHANAQDISTAMDSLSMEPEVTPAQTAQKAEAEAAQQNNEELKRAAVSILDSVADNTSHKFQQSSFLALMKRIAEEQVTLKGEDLVETATGAAYKAPLAPADLVHDD